MGVKKASLEVQSRSKDNKAKKKEQERRRRSDKEGRRTRRRVKRRSKEKEGIFVTKIICKISNLDQAKVSKVIYKHHHHNHWVPSSLVYAAIELHREKEVFGCS